MQDQSGDPARYTRHLEAETLTCASRPGLARRAFGCGLNSVETALPTATIFCRRRQAQAPRVSSVNIAIAFHSVGARNWKGWRAWRCHIDALTTEGLERRLNRTPRQRAIG